VNLRPADPPALSATTPRHPPATTHHAPSPVALHVRDYQRTTLKPRHRDVVYKLAEALFAEGEPMSPAVLLNHTEEVDRAISTASKTMRFGLKLMLDVLRFLPLLLVHKWQLFEDLSLLDRTRVLHKMEHSTFAPFAIIFVAYKTLMTLVFFEQEEVLRDLGYPGPERTRYRLAQANPEAK
jgi:hypothetical protein